MRRWMAWRPSSGPISTGTGSMAFSPTPETIHSATVHSRSIKSLLNKSAA
jgi:hypothetical protein